MCCLVDLPLRLEKKLARVCLPYSSLQATARLYHRIAYDTQWLLNAHENVIKTDEFTRNLCDILKKVTDEG